ncbi:bifunctional 3-(3-hydroxy-phenyl)propionate/3-hydroxycinnamic acid hydroxylase [Pigmentiphaga sp. GD03639]|uniref:bifunctional 3-(3-hydroxy-phenyl)propionate/3-hydroxycinnamic acid hydroxylase n=1 Tax=Pigmentiphaga sp. GD03639 TaxID=2975354 RepID=UPI002446C8E9|nr:bifunctional 3-(3-hydroxy-phenyl)propionate/3-hydroxycinnamic acid hydroxylase [Pigmentiphaga sp. GD03639]MDH2238541.1 bifunctional 3-(3-hydroxy-phenyl)propionate/3-hydroxycinnamic acid hydroxylase [Pigmentiphaga sp. GD03639]
MQATSHYPVIVLGAGPTGLTLANLLGVHGVRTLLLERNASTVDEPRAVSIDDESLRTAQSAGLVDEILPSIVQGYGVHYFSWSGREFARIEPQSTEYGYPKRNAFRQAVLAAQLCAGLERFAHVETKFEHELRRFEQDADKVVLEIDHRGTPVTLSCDWLVACDGGRSGVREQLGIALSGDTFAEKWLIVDLLDRRTPFRHTRTYCDPVRPAIRLPGPQGTVRYEFMLKEGETAEHVLDETRLRGWIRAREPLDEDLPIARKVVYTFHARLAERWRDGRVLLAGDAAHLTPPFAGQGMNSGVRDAANLAWKLDAVVGGRCGPALLDTYELERKPHAWALIEMAMRIGRYMQPKSRLEAMAAQWALGLCSLYPPARDYVLQLKFKPKPRFAQGFFLPCRAPDTAIRAGQLLPQPRMEWPGGARRLLDEALGPGFACLAWAGRPLDPDTDRVVAAAGMRRIELVAAEDDFPWPAQPGAPGRLVVRDCGGVLRRVLAGADARAVLVRPDRYVLAFLSGAPGEAARLRELFDRYGPRR